MSQSQKLQAGEAFPSITVQNFDGGEMTLGRPYTDADWQLVVVYRGRHCPLCTKYLNQLEEYLDRLQETGVDVVAVSGDSREQLESHKEKLNVTFPIGYGLTIEQMKELGVYISHPRSEQETDHPFAEPGIFVVNDKKQLHVVDISNNPFVRPELEPLVSGLAWIRNPKNNYPIRGTYK